MEKDPIEIYAQLASLKKIFEFILLDNEKYKNRHYLDIF